MKLPGRFLVMAKPGGPACNLACDYCYYLGKKSLFNDSIKKMPADILEAYISQRIEFSADSIIHFEWHGGEPTLLGLDYFREIVRIQKKYVRPDIKITNGIQTNGILINEDWADFLFNEKFSVGLSLDGPAELYDIYRKTSGGMLTHSLVENAFRILKNKPVFCNILCVLHNVNVKSPDKVYDYFKEIGVKYIQFLPLAGTGNKGINILAAKPDDIGNFLCRIFDRWISEDVGRIVIQNFDEALRPVYGIEHALCIHRATCGNVAVLEHDGSFYACDHYVDADHRIGNLKYRSLADMANDSLMISFGLKKKDSLPSECLKCEVLSSCNGGCPKDRTIPANEGKTNINYLCPAYKKFFTHSMPELKRLAEHMKAGKTLRSFNAKKN